MDELKGHAPATIDVRNEDELRWWAKELDVSVDEVRGAVSTVGASSEAVRAFLRKAPADRPPAR